MLRKSLFKKPNIDLEHSGSFADNSVGAQQDADVVCTKCGKHIPLPRLKENLMICPCCGRYFRMSARGRISMTADAGTFEELFADVLTQDPIGFPGYEQKVEQAKAQSGEPEGAVTGVCRVNGHKTAIFAMEPNFLMGSMGTAVGEKLTSLFEYALEHKMSVVGYTVSGGARMQEGILSLMQMAKVSGAVGRHSDAGLFYLAVLTDPTTGGATASFAMEGDMIIAEPGALIGFAGPRVIEQTIRQKLPKGFQRAELLLEKGFLDSIVKREELKDTLSLLLSLHEGGKCQ